MFKLRLLPGAIYIPKTAKSPAPWRTKLGAPLLSMVVKSTTVVGVAGQAPASTMPASKCPTVWATSCASYRGCSASAGMSVVTSSGPLCSSSKACKTLCLGTRKPMVLREGWLRRRGTSLEASRMKVNAPGVPYLSRRNCRLSTRA